VKETRGGYVFTADQPGVRESDLDISLAGNVLTLGKKAEVQPRKIPIAGRSQQS
jgi:HSP20 family protein